MESTRYRLSLPVPLGISELKEGSGRAVAAQWFESKLEASRIFLAKLSDIGVDGWTRQFLRTLLQYDNHKPNPEIVVILQKKKNNMLFGLIDFVDFQFQYLVWY